MSVCEKFSMVCWKKQDNGPVLFSRLSCGQWSCDSCAAQNRTLWRAHLKKRVLEMGGQWYFVTLTAPAHARSKYKSLANLRSGLDKLFKRFRRLFGRIDYCRVFELHASGAYHAHIVLRGFKDFVRVKTVKKRKTLIPCDNRAKKRGFWTIETYVRRQAKEVGLGYIVDVSRIEELARVAFYVTKYMTKQAQSYHARGVRRVQCSQSVGAPKRGGSGDWRVNVRLFGSDVDYAGFVDLNTKQKYDSSYWIDNVSYPQDTA